MRICLGNILKCEYVRETAKSVIPHLLHLIVASVASSLRSIIVMPSYQCLEVTKLHLKGNKCTKILKFKKNITALITLNMN